MIGKTETIEEFLARGGIIQKIAAGESAKLPTTRLTTTGDAPVLLSLEEAELFFGKTDGSVKQKKKKESKPKLDASQLPESLKNMLLAKLKDKVSDGEENL
jgi:hypothetical protein